MLWGALWFLTFYHHWCHVQQSSLRFSHFPPSWMLCMEIFSFFFPPFFCYIPPFLMPHFVSCFHTVIGIFLQILSASFKDSNIINGMFQFFPTIFSNIIVALRVSLQLFSFIDATLWDPILIFFMLRSKIFPSTF